MITAMGKENGSVLHSAVVDSKETKYSEVSIERADLFRIAFVGLTVLACLLKVPGFNWLASAATLIGGWPIFREAVLNLREKRMTMELSMSIALFAALAVSESFTALVITLFVLLAECLEGLTMDRGRNGLRQLISIMPQDAFVRDGDFIQTKMSSELVIGDIVVVKPGARLPVDGSVISGHSFVDQSSITGESLPSEKTPGDVVYAGTINQSGTLDVLASGIGMDTAFGKIIQAVEASEQNQARIQKLADRLAGYLVYFAIGCALLTFLVTRNANSTISVVIVAGACGIAVGTPLAILGGIGRAARIGSIVKGGLFLELLSEVDTVAFDKTGTLTYGEPKVVAIEVVGAISEDELLQIAATAESVSEHPLGKAIVAKSLSRNVAPRRLEKFRYEPGRGIYCQIEGEEVLVGNRALLEQKHIDLTVCSPASTTASEVFIARSGIFLGAILLADEVRTEAKKAIEELRSLGIKPILVTGDAKPIAAAIARELCIDEVVAEVMPDEKLLYIRELKQSGRKIAMVGDGINDAPALTEATVGVAVGSGTDAARESADIVLIGNDLGRFVDTVKIARKCRRIILFNFAGTLIVDGVGVLLAAFGLLNPLFAALIHVGSELIFILNSARLLQGKSHFGGFCAIK